MSAWRWPRRPGRSGSTTPTAPASWWKAGEGTRWTIPAAASDPDVLSRAGLKVRLCGRTSGRAGWSRTAPSGRELDRTAPGRFPSASGPEKKSTSTRPIAAGAELDVAGAACRRAPALVRAAHLCDQFRGNDCARRPRRTHRPSACRVRDVTDGVDTGNPSRASADRPGSSRRRPSRSPRTTSGARCLGTPRTDRRQLAPSSSTRLARAPSIAVTCAGTNRCRARRKPRPVPRCLGRRWHRLETASRARSRISRTPRGQVVVQHQGALAGAGGHLNGAPQTPITRAPRVNAASRSRSRSAPATE